MRRKSLSPISLICLTICIPLALILIYAPAPFASSNVLAVGGQLTHTTLANFSGCSTLADTTVANLGDGAVQLAGTLADTFDGPAMDGSQWTWGTWNPGSYTPNPNGTLLIDSPNGAFVRSQNTFSYATIEGTLTFGAAAFQHFGFGD